MNAMEILKRCRTAESDIGRLQQRIDQWRDLLTAKSAPQADPIGGSRGTGDKDKIGRIEAEIDALERQKRAREEAYEAEKVATVALMDMVPELEGRVLHDYYVRHMDTPEIARKEKYTAGYVRKTKRSAEQLLGMLNPARVSATLPAWYLRDVEKDREKGKEEKDHGDRKVSEDGESTGGAGLRHVPGKGDL